MVPSQGKFVSIPANNSYKGMACLTGITQGSIKPKAQIAIAKRGRKINAEALLDLKKRINIFSVAKINVNNY
jgi:hypothetical protein